MGKKIYLERTSQKNMELFKTLAKKPNNIQFKPFVCCRSWLQCTRPCQTTMSIWKALCSNPTWSLLDTAAPPSTAQRRWQWRPSPPCAAPFLRPYLVSHTTPTADQKHSHTFENTPFYPWFYVKSPFAKNCINQTERRQTLMVYSLQGFASCLEVRVKKRPPST